MSGYDRMELERKLELWRAKTFLGINVIPARMFPIVTYCATPNTFTSLNDLWYSCTTCGTVPIILNT